MKELLIVALGGGIGAVTRYAIGNLAALKLGDSFPYGTWIANFIGCLLIGVFMTLINEKIQLHSHWRLLVTVGFLGGLTTFSSFSYETLTLLSESNYIAALCNIGANVCLGLCATCIGIISTRILI